MRKTRCLAYTIHFPSGENWPWLSPEFGATDNLGVSQYGLLMT